MYFINHHKDHKGKSTRDSHAETVTETLYDANRAMPSSPAPFHAKNTITHLKSPFSRNDADEGLDQYSG